MKDIKELPITVQMALAIKTPELFNKKEFERLMKVKNVVMKEMYKEYVKKEAIKITGGLSKPSKMPGPSYNLPATACRTGAKLAKVPGSVCSGCYALKGRYRFPNVQKALNRRLNSLNHPQWIEAMVVLITGEPVMRWHDSGDLQGPDHVKKIFEVCNNTPDTAHWLPTREAEILQSASSCKPANLVIRVSASKIEGRAPSFWPWTSTVVIRDSANYGATKRTCPAPEQDGKCGACRNCWDPAVENVAYAQH